MASSRKIAPEPFKKIKTVPGVPTAGKIIDEYIIPKTPLDVAAYLFPYAKAARAVGGIVKKGAKNVNKIYRNMGV